MTHNLQPFKPITYNLSSEKTGFKVCLSNANLRRYTATTTKMPFIPCTYYRPAAK
jgi:hypothetical protein